jgi:predicted RNase H-like HicB family nuclease
MKESFTAVIKQSNNWWIGWIEEISGVNCQESTKEELLESLRITLKEALDFNRYEAIEAAGGVYEEELIAHETF